MESQCGLMESRSRLWHGLPMSDLDHIDAYQFELPTEQIAAEPTQKRSASRLLCLDDDRHGALADRRFDDLLTLLHPGDLLVVNDAKVTPVRLAARRATGGAVEAFVLGFGQEGRWDDPSADLICLTKSNKRLRVGEHIILDDLPGAAPGAPPATLEVITPAAGGPAVLRTHSDDAWSLLHAAGDLPLPPYIVKRRRELGLEDASPTDRVRYQTVFAANEGAVAAPTAGLHFDDALLQALADNGVERASVTLRVGVGTFAPVRTDQLSEHTLHREYYDVPEATAHAIEATKARGGRVVAVGTTVVRTLEAAATPDGITTGPGSTQLFIRPGFDFQAVDALITNFHLPASTLLALVAAFGGYDAVRAAYAHAVAHGYRFYSYGDAMFIPRRATPSA